MFSLKMVVVQFKMFSLKLWCRKRQLDYKSSMEPLAKRGSEFDYVEVFPSKTGLCNMSCS